jgi:hypothetical protein
MVWFTEELRNMKDCPAAALGLLPLLPPWAETRGERPDLYTHTDIIVHMSEQKVQSSSTDCYLVSHLLSSSSDVK